MKKGLLLIVFTLVFFNTYSQKSYWKKKFNNGTLYVSLVKSDSKFGPHIREYFTGNNSAHLFAVKYYSSSKRYKLQTKKGWSNTNYIYYKGTKLVYKNSDMGTMELNRIDRYDIPKYIREDTYFKRKIVTY